MRLLLLLFVLIGSFAAAQSDRAPNSGPPRTQNVPVGSSLGQLDVQRREPDTSSPNPDIVSGDGRVFYLQSGQVKAVDAETGRQLWTFRAGKWAQLRYAASQPLAVTRNGTVYALEPQTGRVRWSRMGAGIIYAVDDKSLYIVEEQMLLALDLETGKTKWLTREPFFSAFEPFTATKDRIFVYVVNGDAISAAVYIYDARTGKRLGEASSRGPLAIIDRQAFFRNDWFLIDYPDDVYINVHDLKTGKRLESRAYSVENRVRGQD